MRAVHRCVNRDWHCLTEAVSGVSPMPCLPSFPRLWAAAPVALLVGLVLLRSPASAADDQPRSPNIIFILADDLGWADIGYHDSDIRTPHLDGLAAKGVRLNRHYVYPTCSPTRVALLSGQDAFRHGEHRSARGSNNARGCRAYERAADGSP